MKDTKRVYVSKEKMIAALEKRGLARREVSIALGYSADYISSAISANKCNNYKPNISLPAAVALKSLYGIDQSEYEVSEAEILEKRETTHQTTDTIANLTPTELSELIYRSVYAALKHAGVGDGAE